LSLKLAAAAYTMRVSIIIAFADGSCDLLGRK